MTHSYKKYITLVKTVAKNPKENTSRFDKCSWFLRNNICASQINTSLVSGYILANLNAIRNGITFKSMICFRRQSAIN